MQQAQFVDIVSSVNHFLSRIQFEVESPFKKSAIEDFTMFVVSREIEDSQLIDKSIKSNSSVSINWLGYIGLKLMKWTGEFYGADWQSHVNSLSFLQQGNELSNGLSDELA
ncbi:MAG: hypothetical protein JO235_18205, partial [Chroococcidiopsidaceae cyanobacterium CP_BM_RX_35]|nr:hypothetical protein [Chroococcidiopsidaceae cyanobacterium CP_BM_RX_35]